MAALASRIAGAIGVGERNGLAVLLGDAFGQNHFGSALAIQHDFARRLADDGTDMALRAESKGISYSNDPCFLASIPAFKAATTSAPSVGSPTTCHARSPSP